MHNYSFFKKRSKCLHFVLFHLLEQKLHSYIIYVFQFVCEVRFLVCKYWIALDTCLLWYLQKLFQFIYFNVPTICERNILILKENLFYSLYLHLWLGFILWYCGHSMLTLWLNQSRHIAYVRSQDNCTTNC